MWPLLNFPRSGFSLGRSVTCSSLLGRFCPFPHFCPAVDPVSLLGFSSPRRLFGCSALSAWSSQLWAALCLCRGRPLPGGALSSRAAALRKGLTRPPSARPQWPLCRSCSWPHSTLFCPSGKAVPPAVGEGVPPLRLRAPACPLLPGSHSRCSRPILPAALLCRSGASWRPAAGPVDPARLSVSCHLQPPWASPAQGRSVTAPCGLVTRLPLDPEAVSPATYTPPPAPHPFCSVSPGCFDSVWIESWFGFSHGGLSVPASQPEALGSRVAAQSLVPAAPLHFLA